MTVREAAGEEMITFDNGRQGGAPLFPDIEAPTSFRRPVNTPPLFRDPLLQELMRSRPVQRLRRIGFLGAVDRCRSRYRHNRLEHSIGVAQLALLYARNRNLSRHDTRILAAAGLLHDVGHGPLSHTLEPIFKSRFGITHHKSGFAIIRGESSLGREIPDALTRHGLDLDEVHAMIEGTHHGRHAFIFSSPINVDTIEGITRSRSFFLGKSPAVMSAAGIVRTISEANTLPAQMLDSFWRLKHQIYNFAIHHPAGLLYDGLAQAVMTADFDDFAPEDFLRDEWQLRRGKPKLFKFLDYARRSPDGLREILPDAILNHEIDAPIRQFSCDTSVELRTSADLPFRYRQSRTRRQVRIINLLPSKDRTNCRYRVMQGELSPSAEAAPNVKSTKYVKSPGLNLAMKQDS